MGYLNRIYYQCCFIYGIFCPCNVKDTLPRQIAKHFLFYPVFVICNNRISCINNVATRPVILCQNYYFRLRVVLFKMQNIVNICSTKAINALVIITYYTQIFIAVCKVLYQLILQVIRILVLIHHDISVLLLILLQNLRTLFKKLQNIHDKVIKIQTPIFLQDCLIFSIHF